MNIKHASSMAAAWVAGILLAGVPQAAHAQGTITPGGTGRFYVELKDASLADALELVFKAAGNTSYIIDDYARDINVAAITFNNVQWDSIIRQLANQNRFLVRKNETGTYVIEPRTPPPSETEGAAGEGNSGGTGRNPSRRPVPGMPANPFGGATTRGGAKIIANSQVTAPDTGEESAAGDDDEGKEYHWIEIKHLYAGGIAMLFGEATVISTEEFLTPAGGMGGGGSGGFGGGLGGGMMGMGGGGMGGGMGGNTGGGFGGSTGGGFGGSTGGGMGGGMGGGGMGGGGMGGGFGGF